MGNDEDALEFIINKWMELLDLRTVPNVNVDEIHIIPYCSAAKDPPVINISPKAPEIDIAHELGHLALAEKYDLCFGSVIVVSQARNPDESFGHKVRLACQWSDLVIDYHVMSCEPSIIEPFIEDNIELLERKNRQVGQFRPDDLRQSRDYVRVARSAVLIEAYGGDVSELIQSIMEKYEDKYSSHEAARIGKLYNLYKQVGPLPDERFEAIDIFRITTQKTARALGFRVPYLVYDPNSDCHYWTKKKPVKKQTMQLSINPLDFGDTIPPLR